ncbi:MAG: hypothetical protein ACTSYA_06905 [Candidatus Kariarchaeaceae archaeon]
MTLNVNEKEKQGITALSNEWENKRWVSQSETGYDEKLNSGHYQPRVITKNESILVLNLSEMEIMSIPEAINNEIFPNLIAIDLSNNLLTRIDLKKIVKQLPNLKLLDVQKNYLQSDKLSELKMSNGLEVISEDQFDMITFTRAKKALFMTNAMLDEVGEPDKIKKSVYRGQMYLFNIDRLKRWIAANQEWIDKIKQNRSKRSKRQKIAYQERKKEQLKASLDGAVEFLRLGKNIIKLAEEHSKEQEEEYSNEKLIEFIISEYKEYAFYLEEVNSYWQEHYDFCMLLVEKITARKEEIEYELKKIDPKLVDKLMWAIINWEAEVERELGEMVDKLRPQLFSIPEDIITRAENFYKGNGCFSGILAPGQLVAYIRHECTNYDSILQDMMMNPDLYLPLKERINEMISTNEKCLIYINKLQQKPLLEK